MRIFLFLMIVITLAADPASAAKQEVPIKTVRVTPLEFNRETDIVVEPILHDPMQQYMFDYRWFINGEEV
ncbi:hypothetical protein, partial [Vibrio sp.]|uniref:hypothetical protein n=1 Tax=Vibrio sp. TaxID=678 RepID=UPI003D113CDA